MSETPKSTSKAAAPGKPRRAAKPGTPAEKGWFLEWLRRSRANLLGLAAYLGTVIAIVKLWGKLFPFDQGKVVPGPAVWFVAAVLGLPLFFVLIFNIIPAIARAREKRLKPVPGDRIDRDYFTTKPRADDPHGFFAHSYEAFLKWAAAPAAPILHLTGLSGSGKSSLLSAFLAPKLAGAKHPRAL